MERKYLGDTLVGKILTVLYDLIMLNILCVVCALPVVTLGASFTAMYSVMMKVVRRETVHTIKDFFAAFKNNFVPATALWGVGIIGIVLFAGDLWFAIQQQGNMKVLFMAVAILVGALTFSLLAWGFPQIAVFQNSIKGYIKNSLLLAFCTPVQTVGMWILYAIPVVFALFVPWSIVVTVGFLYFMFALSAPCAGSCKLVWKGFQKVDASLVPADKDTEKSLSTKG